MAACGCTAQGSGCEVGKQLAVKQVEGKKGRGDVMGLLAVVLFVGALVGFGLVTRGRTCLLRLGGWVLLLVSLLGFLWLLSGGH